MIIVVIYLKQKATEMIYSICRSISKSEFLEHPYIEKKTKN